MLVVLTLRRFGPRAAAASASVILSATLSCAPPAGPPPRPAPPDPNEQIVAALTKTLQLDAMQQKRTRELLKEKADRDDKIRAGWPKGQRVDPMAFQISQGQLEQEFMAILTPEQRVTFIATKTRLMLQARTSPG